jgi:hypothetical protein
VGERNSREGKMSGLPPPAASMIATYGTCVCGFHSLSISDDNDKLKEKLIKVAKER